MPTYSRFEDLPVWQVAASFFIAVSALTDEPTIHRKGDFANQLERAALSISNNIAEGFEAGTTELLLRYLYIAKGSAGECRSMLTVALALPHVAANKSRVAELRADAEEIGRQLGGWARQLQNTEIEGQRRLTEEGKERFSRLKRQEVVVDQIRRIAEEAREKRERGREGGGM